MRISTLLLTGAVFGAMSTMTSLPASAAVLSVAQVTTGCPDLDQARDCPALAEEFLSSRPVSPTSDVQIISLVVAIAELSQVPRVRLPVCLNAADGIRVLAGGVSTDDQQAQIEDIADALCIGTNTAAIRRGLDLNSLASAGDSGNTGGAGGAGGIGGTGGGGGGGDDDDDDGNNGHGNDDDHDDGSNPGQGGGGGGGDASSGLGSNDASAGHASATGESHANEHAVNNENGKNGN